MDSIRYLNEKKTLFQIKKEKFRLERYAEVSSYDYTTDTHKISQLNDLLSDCKYVDSGNPER